MDIRIHEERGAGEGTIVPKGQVVPFWPLTDSNRLYLTIGKECRSVMFCYKRSDSIVLKLTNKVRGREREGRREERREERVRERRKRLSDYKGTCTCMLYYSDSMVIKKYNRLESAQKIHASRD